MKIACVTLAYNDEGTIGAVLKCAEPYVDKHIVLISEVPYFGEPAPPDRTEEICEEHGVDIIKGSWELDHLQRNVGNKMCEDCDWVVTLDSDELLTKDGWNDLLDFLSKTEAEAVVNQPIVYWKSTKYILSPRPAYEPVIATRPSARFSYIRNLACPFIKWNGDMHHLSWCDPKDIKKKVLNYAHATDFNGEIWYKAHYENWTLEKDKVAVLPTETFQVEEKPLPDELERLLG